MKTFTRKKVSEGSSPMKTFARKERLRSVPVNKKNHVRARAFFKRRIIALTDELVRFIKLLIEN